MTEILRTSFSEYYSPDSTKPPVPRMVQIGRGILGVHGWRLLDEIMRPMNSLHQSAWARALGRNPEQAIRDYAEVRGVEPERVEAAIDEFLTDRSGYAKA